MDTERKTSILIVDDNRSMTHTLALILRRKGFRVTTAMDGQEAVAKVKEMPFDTILMDVKMPLMNGVEAFKRIKRIRPRAAVMMMTAYAVEDLVQEALKEGACGIVYKPLDIAKVIALIEETRKNSSGLLILVVDDDPGTCVTLKSCLTAKGYEVGITHTGEEAIAMAQQMVYDIIFIEMRLPMVNGLETYLAIKEINPTAVAIIMTACRQEMAGLVEEALRHSVYTCLEKPLDVEVVLKLVEEIRQWKQMEMTARGSRDWS